MKKLIIIGHKNPDTDSVVSAFILRKLLEKVPNLFPWFSSFKISSARAGSLNKETKFVFNYFKETPPPLIKSIKGKNVFLIDHNGYSQAAEGVEQANILGVMDHHNLEGLKTVFPLFYHAEPIGSTSTIIAKIFINNNVSLSKKIAGLSLSAILSDTVKFTSPTTTPEDEKIAMILAEVSNENIEKLSKEMFKAKSDITGIGIQDLISQDYKEFESGKTNFGVGVWETTNPEQIKKKEKEIFSALFKFKRKRKLDLIFFALVDILKGNSLIFISGKEEKIAAEVAFRKKVKENFLFLPGVISRKKQIIPPLENFLSDKSNANI